MNKVCMMGRFTKDPVIRVTTGDKPTTIATFTLAVQDDYNNQKADFITCKAFNKTAEVVERYCHKGDLIGAEGKISTGSYEKDGKKVFTTDVVVNQITFTPKFAKQETTEDVPAELPTGFAKLDDDDLPF